MTPINSWASSDSGNISSTNPYLLKINRARAILQSNQLFLASTIHLFRTLPLHFMTGDNNMAVYGTYAQDGLSFTITSVSSSSDAKNPAFDYEWSRTNSNWTLTPDHNGAGATLSGAHASDTGSVTVTVTETGTKNSREFGGAVDTRNFPA
jgi:hypothetical protein